MMKYDVDCQECQIYVDQYHELERLILKFDRWHGNWLKRLWWRLTDPVYTIDVDRMMNLMISMMMTHHHFVRHRNRADKYVVSLTIEEVLHIYDWYNKYEHEEDVDDCYICQKLDKLIGEYYD